MDSTQDTIAQDFDPESLENQGVQEQEIDGSHIAPSKRQLSFELVNDVTWKITDGRGSLAWSGDRSGAYRTTRAIGWLMAVGEGLWVARYRTKASRPLKLNACKRHALEMISGIRPGIQSDDWIRHLLETTKAPKPAKVVEDISWIETINRPLVNVAFAGDDLVESVIRTETGHAEEEELGPPLQGDDFPLTYDENGYPELPACIDRRHD